MHHTHTPHIQLLSRVHTRTHTLSFFVLPCSMSCLFSSCPFLLSLSCLAFSCHVCVLPFLIFILPCLQSVCILPCLVFSLSCLAFSFLCLVCLSLSILSRRIPSCP